MANPSTEENKLGPSAAEFNSADVQRVEERLLTIARKSSAPEEDPEIKELARTQPKLLVRVAAFLCFGLQSTNTVGNSDAHPLNLRLIALRGLLRLKLPFEMRFAQPVFDYILEKTEINTWNDPLLLMVGLAEQLMRDEDLDRLPRSIERSLMKIRDELDGAHAQRNERKAIERIDVLLGQSRELPLKPGDAISDVIIADLESVDPAERAKWIALLKHCSGATGSKPAKSWLKVLDPLLAPLAAELAPKLARWFPRLVETRSGGKPARINPSNYETLTGLTRCAAVFAERGNHDPSLAAALQSVAIAAYLKVPGLGRRCPKVGDAAVAALSQYPTDVAASRISAIQRAARNPVTDETLNAALDALAVKAGVPREQLEELTIPTFGLSLQGTREIPLGPATAILDISTGSAELTYRNDKGKPIKSIPAAVKRDHADALKALKQEVKDLDKLVASQRDRLDALVASERTWPLGQFRKLYLEHPLISRVACRLIWTVDQTPSLFRQDRFEDVEGRSLKSSDASIVSPWHPIRSTADGVFAWRRRLESLQITQPFKQAHREIYLLTDAERTTHTYSNRFAAHIIRQAQFRALANARGWNAPLLGGWDNGGSIPSRELPAQGLRIEFWVDAAPIEQVGDTQWAGVGAAFLTTDQVRFCRLDQPNVAVPLDQIPPLVLSESLRDVDLFVSVCSVGNDATWQDAATRTAAQRAYWQNVSFGDLSESAKTRRAVLESLLPRLTKLRDRWELADRYLVIRGEIRTYKIHLGSSNILMEPNDQYLCIVPSRSIDPTGSSSSGRQDIFLPFEGDSILSVILSKAFLLADDKAITDTTITRQISPAR
jgi:hypothetical protein